MLTHDENAVATEPQTEEVPKIETLDILDFDWRVRKLLCQRVDDDVYAVFVRVRGAVAYGLEPDDVARKCVRSPYETLEWER